MSALERSRRSFDIFRWICAPSKPVISIVQGYRIGAGTQLAESCDLVVSTDVEIGLPKLPMGVGLVRAWHREQLAQRVEADMSGMVKDNAWF
jgi:enoyl-CoA hydratase/carnithine racemase